MRKNTKKELKVLHAEEPHIQLAIRSVKYRGYE
jgi:hypothetical protein